VRLSEPHFDDQPRCNDDAECAKRSYDYAKDKLTGFAPFRLYRCVLKARILLRKPVLSLDTLFSRQVSHVADPKFVPDLGSTEALKASAILVRYCHHRFAPAASPVRSFRMERKVASSSHRSLAILCEPKSWWGVLYPPQANGSGNSPFYVGHFDAVKLYPILEPFFVERITRLKYF